MRNTQVVYKDPININVNQTEELIKFLEQKKIQVTIEDDYLCIKFDNASQADRVAVGDLRIRL